MREKTRPSIELAADPGGGLIYQVGLAPDALPPVRSGDLADGWDVARRAAAASHWGRPRTFRFRSADADPVDLALNDDDAACWAEAIDNSWGLRTAYGLSLCLRLLALVALMSDCPAVRALCPLSRAGIMLDPGLVRAAACIPLSMRGHLDEERVLAHLAHTVASSTADTISPPGVGSCHTGSTASS